MDALIQQRNISIYIVAAISALGVLAWRRLPERWRYVRYGLLAWVIIIEWLVILLR